MRYSVPEMCSLFKGIPAEELQKILKSTAHHTQSFDKGETIFHLMEPAAQIGIILKGSVEAQKPFPNGSQINVSVKRSGEMIGSAAAFSVDAVYPCDIVAVEPCDMMLFRKEDLLTLMQKDVRILENFTTEIASAAYMLQQRLELLSYNGIAQKAAVWLLMRSRKSQTDTVRIPGSVSRWAMTLNVSRPSLHRELKRLADNDMICYAPPFITILDRQALQDLLNQ